MSGSNVVMALRRVRRAELETAYTHWRLGKLCPARITTALDLRGLHGPEVDIACLVKEPAVDEWEAGNLYPTWEQFLALVVLTDCPPGFFTTVPPPGIPVWQTSMWFTMSDEERLEAVHDWRPTVLTFSRRALDAARLMETPSLRPDLASRGPHGNEWGGPA